MQIIPVMASSSSSLDVPSLLHPKVIHASLGMRTRSSGAGHCTTGLDLNDASRNFVSIVHRDLAAYDRA